MKTNEKTIQSAMDKRLSFLDELPSCRAAVQYRIAQEEEPVMKKKISFSLVFAIVMILLAAAALATGLISNLLMSPKATATQLADKALEEKYGINAEMQSFLGRDEKELDDGTVQITYYGYGDTEYVLGVYTAVIRDGKAEITWSHDGEDTSGGYDAEAWGVDQITQMMTDSRDEKTRDAYLAKANRIGRAHHVIQDEQEPETETLDFDTYVAQLEATKDAAMNARKIPEDEMIEIGRQFIISYYGLNEEQVGRLELYTNFGGGDAGNGWYEMIDGKPCFQVEYLLGQPEVPEVEGQEAVQPKRMEKDGYYVVFVNVETGEVEEYDYNSGLGGLG